MCGIAGILDPRPEAREALGRRAARMAESLRHRGPDDGDVWADAAAGIALANRRLAVIDPRPEGRQPMVSADGRWVLVYNGEIYNHAELAAQLEAAGARLRSRADSEVFLEWSARWGVRAALDAAEGMFAFALWDRHDRRLTLGRDRLGIKPLYCGRFGRQFLFGSELKALVAAGGWPAEIDRAALGAFMRFGYVPAPRSIYRGVGKLEPGTLLEIAPGADPTVARYWDLRAHAFDAGRRPLDLPDPELVDALERQLRRAVRSEMVADVPLGAFLSGGIDSSTVVALMQAESTRPVKTFTVGFGIDAYDEARHAGRVARHLGTDHTELRLEPAEARAAIPEIPEHFDEPFADSSQIPTQIIARLAREQVTVALSGDGGDELFAGYERYRLAQRWHRRLGVLPGPLRGAAAGALRSLPAAPVRAVAALLPSALRPERPVERARRLADMLADRGSMGFYRRLVAQWEPPERVVPGAGDALDGPWGEALEPVLPAFVERMQFVDTLTYLPDDILTKVDRATMAASLEARVPLLNHKVVEFAWRLPLRAKLRGGLGKWALRQVLHRHVPRALVDRPKMGFGVPLAEWLRGPLRDWADDLLSEPALRASGLLAPEPIVARWRAHRTGAQDWSYSLWCPLMFQSWRLRWMEPAQPAAEPGDRPVVASLRA